MDHSTADDEVQKMISGTRLPKSLLSRNVYEVLATLVQMTARAAKGEVAGCAGCLIVGAPGVAKSSVVFEVLASEGLAEGDGYHVVSGFTTPLALFECLYSLNGDNVVVCDDLLGWTSPTSIALLKSALSDAPVRRVSYKSSALSRDTPDSFVLKSRLVFICNKQPSQSNEDVQALLSRVLTARVDLSLKERLDFCERVLVNEERYGSTREERKQVLQYVRHAASSSRAVFDFRMFWKLVSVFKFDRARFDTLARDILPPCDPCLALLIEAHRRFHKQTERATWWCKETGMSRRTYFDRIKQHRKVLAEVMR